MQPLMYHGQYGDYLVTLKKAYYENNRLAIQAFDEDGCPAFTATVNVPNQTIFADEAFIKDYAENQGVLAFLHENGIVTEIIRWVKSGYVTIPLCKIDTKRLDRLIFGT